MGRDYHNSGQEDAANDSGYNPPHGTFSEIVESSFGNGDKVVEENSSYRGGHEHGKSQK